MKRVLSIVLILLALMLSGCGFDTWLATATGQPATGTTTSEQTVESGGGIGAETEPETAQVETDGPQLGPDGEVVPACKIPADGRTLRIRVGDERSFNTNDYGYFTVVCYADDDYDLFDKDGKETTLAALRLAQNALEEEVVTPETEGEETAPEEIPGDQQTADGTWRVRLNQDLSYGPELGHSRPGMGTAENEIGIAVGVDLSVIIGGREIMLAGGCQQIAVMPNVYARDAGGNDWGYRTYVFNEEVTQWQDELVVLSHEWARQQINHEDCPELSDQELLIHTYVLWTDEEAVLHLTPWQEFRRPSGENNVIMGHPSDKTVRGWHCGYEGSENDIADNGKCYIEDVNHWIRLGGGVIHPWTDEIGDATPIVLPEPTPVP